MPRTIPPWAALFNYGGRASAQVPHPGMQPGNTPSSAAAIAEARIFDSLPQATVAAPPSSGPRPTPQLLDRIQLECLARSDRFLQITVLGDLGELHFRDGHIVHATTLELSGEAAAIEILQWDRGIVEEARSYAPPVETISRHWQELLQRARQVWIDAQGMSSPAEVAPSPPLTTLPPDSERPSTEAGSDSPDSMRNPSSIHFPKAPRLPSFRAEIPPPPSDDRPLGFELAEFDTALTLGPRGSIRESRGDVRQLAGQVAYGEMVLNHVGRVLDAGDFTAMECTLRSGATCFVFRNEQGHVVGGRIAAGGSSGRRIEWLRSKLEA